MKRSVLWIMFIAALLCLCAAPIVRAQSGPPGQICQGVPPPIDYNTCVNCATVFVQDSHAGAVCFCKFLIDIGEFDGKLGACVSVIAQNGGTGFGASNLSIVTLSTLLMGWGAFQFFRRRRSVSSI